MIAALAAAGLFAGTLSVSPVGAASRPHATKIKVGVVLDVGGVNDRSFNQGSWDGALGAAKGKFGFTKLANVSASYIATPTADQFNTPYYQQELQQFVNHGYKVVIAVGFAMEDAIYDVACGVPNSTSTGCHPPKGVKFGIVDGWPTHVVGGNDIEVDLSNVANMQFEAEQSGFDVGYLAGLADKNHIAPNDKNIIGTLGGVPYPTVTGYMCGYMQGARLADPSIKVVSGFDLTFNDASAAKTDGADEIGAGANILFQVDGGAGLGFMQAAQNAGDWAIGVDVPQGYLGSYIITSALKGLSVAVYDTIKGAVSGHFKGKTNYYTLKNNGTGFDQKYLHHIPKSYVTKVESINKKIIKGQIKIAGPNPWDHPMINYGTGACKADNEMFGHG